MHRFDPSIFSSPPKPSLQSEAIAVPPNQLAEVAFSTSFLLRAWPQVANSHLQYLLTSTRSWSTSWCCLFLVLRGHLPSSRPPELRFGQLIDPDTIAVLVLKSFLLHGLNAVSALAIVAISIWHRIAPLLLKTVMCSYSPTFPPTSMNESSHPMPPQSTDPTRPYFSSLTAEPPWLPPRHRLLCPYLHPQSTEAHAQEPLLHPLQDPAIDDLLHSPQGLAFGDLLVLFPPTVLLSMPSPGMYRPQWADSASVDPSPDRYLSRTVQSRPPTT